MLRRVLHLAWPLTLAGWVGAACNALPDLDFNQCGNGVLEPEAGEDCDSREDDSLGSALYCAPPGPQGCNYVCTGTHLCPTGWGCGQDQVCRLAQGRFEAGPGTPVHGAAPRIATGDLDGDGESDVVLHADRSVRALFSRGDGALSLPASVDIGRGLGAPIITPASSGEGGQVVAPLPSGLHLMRTTAERTLEGLAHAPYDLSVLTGGKGKILTIERAGAVRDELLLLFDGQGGLTVTAFVGRNASVTLSDLRLSRLPGRVSTADIDGATRPFRSDEVLLAARGDPMVTIVGLTCAVPGGVCADEDVGLEVRTRLSMGGPVHAGARFVDVDGDGRVDVQASVKDDNDSEERLVWAPQGPDGRFLAAREDPRVAQSCGGLCASVWPVAAQDLNADGPADFVIAEGVLHTQPVQTATPTPPLGFVYLPQLGPLDTIAEAVIGDFNYDGRPDVIIAGEQVEGVELLLSGPRLIYNGFFEPTDGTARNLRVGDFDGDLVDDLAVVLDEAEGSRVEVLYGRSQGPLHPPISMGRFGYVQQLETGVILGTDLAPIDGRWDLLLQATPDRLGAGQESSAVLLGTAQRLMLAPYVLSQGLVTEAPVAVVAGDFDRGHPGWDLFAFTSSAAWTVASGDSERFAAGAAVRHGLVCALPKWSDCTLAGTTPSGKVLALSPAYPCVPGEDDAPSTAYALDPHGDTAPTCQASTLPTPLRAPISLAWADLEPQPGLELLVAFHGLAGPRQSVPQGAGVLVARLDAEGRLSPSAVLSVPPAFGSVFGAVAANIDGDQELEILVATDTGVYVWDRADAIWAPRQDPLQLGQGEIGPIRSLATLDLNRDGLSDLLLGTKDALHVALGVKARVNEVIR